MKEEMASLHKNRTWILVDKPENQKLVGCKWIFKKKEGVPGVEKPRYKARLVAKGFTQKEGLDYNEIFSPVVKQTSIRVVMALVAQYNLELQQMDVTTAFLHGDLEETIFMKQPEGYEEGNNKVCLLKKSLYGLKQSPRQWNKRFDLFMNSIGYQRSQFDSCVYMNGKRGRNQILLLLYVDDILLAGKELKEINILKRQLKGEFEMKDMGNARKILGIDILRNRLSGKLILSQSKYIQKILERCGMDKQRQL